MNKRSVVVDEIEVVVAVEVEDAGALTTLDDDRVRRVRHSGPG
jgi:hypothetical protein